MMTYMNTGEKSKKNKPKVHKKGKKIRFCSVKKKKNVSRNMNRIIHNISWHQKNKCLIDMQVNTEGKILCKMYTFPAVQES